MSDLFKVILCRITANGTIISGIMKYSKIIPHFLAKTCQNNTLIHEVSDGESILAELISQSDPV